MKDKIIIAGSGGQGIQFIGQVLAMAAVEQGLEATYVPSYGAERRGGMSFGTVVVADQPIYSPIFREADVLLALDQRARNIYGAQVGAKGVILANQELAAQPAAKEQARALMIASNKKGNSALNLVMLGAYLGLGRGVRMEMVEKVLKLKSSKKPHLLAGNIESLHQGVEAIKGLAV